MDIFIQVVFLSFLYLIFEVIQLQKLELIYVFLTVDFCAGNKQTQRRMLAGESFFFAKRLINKFGDFKMKTFFITLASLVCFFAAGVHAEEGEQFAPYGHAQPTSIKYEPIKLVMELSGATPADMAVGLGIAKQFQHIAPKGSKMALVIIGGGIRAFAIENYEKYQAIVDKAAELRDSGMEIKFCGNSIKGAGYKDSDIDGIGEVVPGGYLEIARYVGEGYVHITPRDYKTKGARFIDHPELKPQPAAAPKQ